jgi:hypothetical protein
MQGERAWVWNLPKSQESCGKLPSDPEPLHFRNSSWVSACKAPA